MELYQLKYFLVVCNTCNFTKAANELYLSRQAVAQSVHQLEESLGGTLFENKKNSLTLTPLGEVFRHESEKIVQSFNAFESSMKKYAGNQTNQLNVAMGAGISVHLTTEAFTEFSRTYHNILLSIKESDNLKMITQLLNGEIDLALIGSSPQYLTQFKTTLIKKSDLCLCVNTQNPLSEKDFLTFDDLKGQPIVGHGSDYDLHRFYVSKCHEHGFQPVFSMISTDPNMAWKLTQENRSLCFGFTDKNTPIFTQDQTIKIIPLQLNEPDEWGIYAVTRMDEKRTIPQRLFINFLLQHTQGVETSVEVAMNS